MPLFAALLLSARPSVLLSQPSRKGAVASGHSLGKSPSKSFVPD